MIRRVTVSLSLLSIVVLALDLFKYIKIPINTPEFLSASRIDILLFVLLQPILIILAIISNFLLYFCSQSICFKYYFILAYTPVSILIFTLLVTRIIFSML
jgi:hypothetical protein